METVSTDLLEKYRYINVDEGWDDLILNLWTEKLRKVGVDSPAIMYSGFYCQGDGAMFTGSIAAAKFMKAHKLHEKYPHTYRMAREFGGVHGTINHSGSYYHENTARFDFIYSDFVYYLGVDELEESDLRYGAVRALDMEREAEQDKFENEVIDICRDYMRQIYRDLQNEYEYLTCDDAVQETLEANAITD